MTLATFFKKFDSFADAPDAVAKMRELLIHFAVTGKLVPNDLKEKPVELKLSGATEGETLLPVNWRAGFLGDAFNFEYGDNLPAPKRSQTGEYTVYGSNGIVGTHDAYLTKEPAIIVGRKGSAGALNIATGPSWTTDVAYFVCPPKDVDLRFTYYLFSTLQLDDLGKGIKPGLSRKDAYALPIALPPLAEQKRIVAKVDELMALCDRLEAQQQERDTRHADLARASLARFAEAPTPANLHFLFHKSYTIPPADLRKSILTLAFAGKLVSQDPNDEPASVLLEKARAEKARLIDAGLVKKEPWADKLQDATTLYELPPGWEWTHVSNVVEKVTVGFVGSMKEEYRVTGVPFLRCQNVRVNRYEPIGLTFISKEFHRSISKSTLRPGDVVVTRSGNVGVTCVIPESLPEANCSDLVIVKRPLALVPAFLSYFINSIASGQIEAKTVGIALTHFNTQSVAQMTVALPPLAEQRRIVAKVDQLMALVDELETQLAASRATAKNLLDALVAELISANEQ